jgi:hypothetical protein
VIIVVIPWTNISPRTYPYTAKCSLSCCNIHSFGVKFVQEPEIGILQKYQKDILGLRIKCPPPPLCVVSCALDRQALTKLKRNTRSCMRQTVFARMTGYVTHSDRETVAARLRRKELRAPGKRPRKSLNAKELRKKLKQGQVISDMNSCDREYPPRSHLRQRTALNPYLKLLHLQFVKICSTCSYQEHSIYDRPLSVLHAVPTGTNESRGYKYQH